MVLECDQKEKEERINYIRETRDDNELWVGNVSLKCGKEMVEKSFSEVIKNKDSESHCEDHKKHKFGEQWYLVGADARHFFISCVPSMIKCSRNKLMWRKNQLNR